MKSNELTNPFTLKSLSLSGRVVMAPMTRSRSPHNTPGADVAEYYRRRVENNVALIITEGTVVDPAGHAYPDVPNFYGKEALQGWKHVVENVHAGGGRIFPQLWHSGSVRQEGMAPDSAVPGYAPSPILHPSLKEGTVPGELSEKDIENVIAAFARAAHEAKQIGFDGIELHGAHGYLIDQFFWDRTNHRTDAYGGSNIAERTRFAVDLIRAVRQEVGADFISNRMSPEKNKPLGSEKTIQYLLERLERDEFDLIAVGRALLADPEWVTKVIDDRFEEINTFTMESLNTLY